MKILYFAWLRQKIGIGEEQIDVPGDVTTPQALVEYLRNRGETYALAFSDVSAIKVAVNQEFADYETLLKPGDEVAFFPPVTGG